MKLVSAQNIVCPIDGNQLIPRNQSLICTKGHNFDIAKQGYFNLLIVQHKASRDPGDTKEMVAARRRFLSSGCYEAIATTIADITHQHLKYQNSLTILDAGCGEGYYLNRLSRISENWESPAEGVMIGMDISKWAIQAAAKSDRSINLPISWIVGSNARPPFAPNSIDSILCAFGFPSFDIFHRLLKPKGIVIMVDPAPDHLRELRQLIYPELKSKAVPTGEIKVEGFRLLDSQNLTYQAQIDSSNLVQDLFLMTPHYFRSSPESKKAIACMDKLEFTVDVSFRVLIKK